MGVQYELEQTELTDERINAELRGLEEKYGMTTAQFLAQYNRGEVGDDLDFINWAGLITATQAVGARGRRVNVERA